MMKILKTLVVLFFIAILSGCSKSLNNSENNINKTENKNLDTLNDPVSKKFSLNEIFQKKENLKCIFVNVDEKNNNHDVFYYIDSINKRIRINSNMIFEDNTTRDINIIIKDSFMYSWINSNSIPASIGTKFDITDPSNNNIDFNEIVDLKCENWIVDYTYFDLPVNVDFQSY